MADVFLSYARADAATAQKLASRLRDAGYSVWFDEQLPAHRAYADVIDSELEAAQAVLVLWSTDATGSQWVRSEANRAREAGKLIQARLDDSRLPMPFDQIQCADLRDRSWKRQQPKWRTVLESVDALVSGELSSRAGDQPPSKGQPRPVHRRQLLIAGGGAAVLGAAGFAGWRGLGRNEPALSPRAEMLLERGMAALQDNDALDPQGLGSTMQAISLLSEATQAAPESAMAWGALAMAYAVRKRVAPLAERPGLDMRSRSAAAKSLEIDSREARALGALRLIEPVYRNWLAAERGHRAALAKNSNLPILIFIMSDMLGNVGRWKDAVKVAEQFDQQKFLLPGANRKLILTLWGAGDLQGADAALATTVRQWPQHPQIWRTHLRYLMYTGRPGEAMDLLSESADRPADVSADYVDALRTTADGLAGLQPAQVAVSQNLEYLQNHPAAALEVAQACAALGDPQSAFHIWGGYYFGEGEWSRVAPTNGDQDRITSTLFHPPMRPLWADRQFESLLDRIGLNAYWRQSGTQPDYRGIV